MNRLTYGVVIEMNINYDKVRKAWKNLLNDDERWEVSKGNFPHKLVYLELNHAEHLELQRIAEKYWKEIETRKRVNFKRKKT